MVVIKPVKLKKRGNSYQLYYYTSNKERRRLSVGTDNHYAQRMAIKFTDWLLEGKDPELEIKTAQQNEQAKMLTLREFYEIFLERHRNYQSQSMQEFYKYRFNNIKRCPQLADVPLKCISKRLVLDYMHIRMKHGNVSTATANREAAVVKSMLSRATEWDILDRNPIQGLRLFPEAAKLLVELSEPVANIVEFAFYSGFRKENILCLTIEQIRFHDLTETGEVDLIIKGGRSETFPIGNLAIKVLKRAIGTRKKGFVFLNPRTGTRYFSINKVFDRAVRKVGLKVNGTKFRFHDLRHAFASWNLKAGVSLDIIRELMGHKDRSTTDRYATINRPDIRNELNVLPNIRGENIVRTDVARHVI